MITSITQVAIVLFVGFLLFARSPKKIKQLIKSFKMIKSEFKKPTKESSSIGRALVSKAKS